MMNLRLHGKGFDMRGILSILVVLSCSAAGALAAHTITGSARNQSRSQPAAGDEVILVRLDRGMQEEAHSMADAQGTFAFNVQYPDRSYLVRMVHQGVNYDQRALAGDVVSIDVFDAAAKVQGVTGSIEIIRAGTNGTLLHVSDMVEIKNDSSPPLTQAGERTFEVYLPSHAKIDSVLAAGSGTGSEKVAVLIPARPVPGELGHYTVNFPLRPGATKFAFNYDLPYDGHALFRTKSVHPLQQLAVMIPRTMKFTSVSPAFQVLRAGDDGYQVEAANVIKAGENLRFEVSGVGALPALQAQTQSPPKPSAAASSTPALSARGSSALLAQGTNALSALPASASSAPSSRLQWWVLTAGAVLVLGPCGLLLSRRQRLSANEKTRAVQGNEQRGQTSSSLADALKDELFQLEIDRLRGAISGEEYDSARQALEGTIERAVARARAGIRLH